MKKRYGSTYKVLRRSSGIAKVGEGDATYFRLGGIPVARLTRTNRGGRWVTVVVNSSEWEKLARATTKQILAIVAKPISDEQRKKARELADKAREGQESPVTAKFRRIAA